MALTILLHAPADIRYRRRTANGRDYVGVPGTPQYVNQGDAHVLLSNGWLHAFVCRSCAVGTTTERPTGPVAGDKFFDTTVGAELVHDGAAWRNVITGAAA